MGRLEKGIMYKVIILPDAEKSFKKLDKAIQVRIAAKIDWLADNAETIVHHLLSSLPDDLKGLCKVKAGDYRVLYWVYKRRRLIKIYIIEHRSKVYRLLRR